MFIAVFFFPVKIALPSVKIFAVASVKNPKCAWTKFKKYTWKTQSARESFEKISYVKIRFLDVKKKNKNCMRENQKVAVKNLGKVFECTFFCKRFSILWQFFSVYTGFYIIDPKFCVWK